MNPEPAMESQQTPFILTILMGAGGATATPCKGEEDALEFLRTRSEDWTKALLSIGNNRPPIKVWGPTPTGIKEVAL